MGQPRVASATWRDRIRRISLGFYETVGQQIPQTRESEPMRAWSHAKILNRVFKSTPIFLRKAKGISQTFRLLGWHCFKFNPSWPQQPCWQVPYWEGDEQQQQADYIPKTGNVLATGGTNISKPMPERIALSPQPSVVHRRAVRTWHISTFNQRFVAVLLNERNLRQPLPQKQFVERQTWIDDPLENHWVRPRPDGELTAVVIRFHPWLLVFLAAFPIREADPGVTFKTRRLDQIVKGRTTHFDFRP